MDLIKNLTGKNPQEYEPVARRIIDEADLDLFSELVSKDEFLFDFIKRNVAQRLSKACNQSNYKNLFKFFDIYSPYYEEFITSTLAQFATENDIKTVLEYLKSGSDSAKTYAAGFFSYIKNNDALNLLRENAYCDNSDLCANCARALSALKDEESYKFAIEKLKSKDDFETFKAVKFLVGYQKNEALPELLKVMKTSGMSENIAAEIPYLVPLTELLNTDYNDDAILVFCHILNGLAEIIPVSQVADFRIYELIDTLLKASPTGPIATALMMAKDKFNLFVENEEYLFDEDKNTKTEINDINILLKKMDIAKYVSFLYEELFEESEFIFFVLELIRDEESLASLLSGNNQTVILKAMTTLKMIGKLSKEYKDLGLSKITDNNLKSVAEAL